MRFFSFNLCFLLSSSFLLSSIAYGQQAPANSTQESVRAESVPAKSTRAQKNAPQVAAKKKAPLDDNCTENFDSSATCLPLQQDPLATLGEPLAVREDVPVGFGDEAEDPSVMGWRLVGFGGMAAVVGLGFQTAALAYFQNIQNAQSPTRIRKITAEELDRNYKGMALTGGISVVSFVVSAVFVGSGLAFFTFDPRNGKMRLPDPEKK